MPRRASEFKLQNAFVALDSAVHRKAARAHVFLAHMLLKPLPMLIGDEALTLQYNGLLGSGSMPDSQLKGPALKAFRCLSWAKYWRDTKTVLRVMSLATTYLQYRGMDPCSMHFLDEPQNDASTGLA